jgi:seryl-tRNA synthetase
MKINKQERDHHETVVCEYRKMNCHDCEQIQEFVGKLEGRLIDKMQRNHVEMEKVVGKLEGSLVEMNKNLNEKVEGARDDARHETKQVKNEVEEVKEEVKCVKANLSKVNTDMDEVKAMMSQMLTKLKMP